MKKTLLIAMVILLSSYSQAQFNKAYLQATGLTCALCSNAINKALQKISFVESVKPDIKNSAFTIVFKQNASINIDEIKKAVDDAGFSVGSLKLTGNFHDLKVYNDEHITIGNETFHFLNVTNQVLNGEKTITIIDKNFVTTKEFKKISLYSKMSCLQTGKADDCCTKYGVAANTRVYHVTM